MARPTTIPNAKRTTVNLPSKLQKECARLAKQRYGISFSAMLSRLLVKEKNSPKGLVHGHPRELSVA